MLCPRQGANCCYIDDVKLLQDLIKKVLKAALIAIRGTRASLYQKQADEGADVAYNVVALLCKDDFLRPQCRESLSV